MVGEKDWFSCFKSCLLFWGGRINQRFYKGVNNELVYYSNNFFLLDFEIKIV